MIAPAAAIKIGAERRAGQLIAGWERAQGVRDGRKGLRTTLVQSSIPPMTAHRWQTMAEVPEAEREFRSGLERNRGRQNP